MAIRTRSELIDTLRTSGIFPRDQFAEVVRELGTHDDDLKSAIRTLVESGRATVYQLKKVVHGKAAELIVGEYVISDKLGEGGMGKVYRARHMRIGREVALKIVRPHLLANPVIRGRYEREVKAAAALQHPNIVAVKDAGESDGKTWLALEFVDGIDLSRLVRDHGLLAVPEACEYLRQAALGLQHAHDLGFVHRDIKPSNIIVSGERHLPKSRGAACAKILDMGLVRGGFDDDAGGLDLTRAGTVVGTPDYMAPEQARNSSTVDHRADVYALGCTFYLLLTGQPPFPSGSALDKLLKHQTEPPRPLQLERGDVHDGLAAVIAKMMAKKPAERFGTAAEVATALQPFTQYGKGSAALPPAARRAPATPTTANVGPAPATVPMAEPVANENQEPSATPFDFSAVESAGNGPKSLRTPRAANAQSDGSRRVWIIAGAIALAAAAVAIPVALIARKSGTAPQPGKSEKK